MHIYPRILLFLDVSPNPRPYPSTRHTHTHTSSHTPSLSNLPYPSPAQPSTPNGHLPPTNTAPSEKPAPLGRTIVTVTHTAHVQRPISTRPQQISPPVPHTCIDKPYPAPAYSPGPGPAASANLHPRLLLVVLVVLLLFHSQYSFCI